LPNRPSWQALQTMEQQIFKEGQANHSTTGLEGRPGRQLHSRLQGRHGRLLHHVSSQWARQTFEQQSFQADYCTTKLQGRHVRLWSSTWLWNKAALSILVFAIKPKRRTRFHFLNLNISCSCLIYSSLWREGGGGCGQCGVAPIRHRPAFKYV
jgi:hypothetical protein